jgi:hypothetical protein
MSEAGGKRVRIDPKRRAGLIEEFERSDLTAAAFVRRHRLNYGTFCGWLHRRPQVEAIPAFVELDVVGQPSGAVVVELGSGARTSLTDERQVKLLARLIHACDATGSG